MKMRLVLCQGKTRFGMEMMKMYIAPFDSCIGGCAVLGDRA